MFEILRAATNLIYQLLDPLPARHSTSVFARLCMVDGVFRLICQVDEVCDCSTTKHLVCEQTSLRWHHPQMYDIVILSGGLYRIPLVPN